MIYAVLKTCATLICTTYKYMGVSAVKVYSGDLNLRMQRVVEYEFVSLDTQGVVKYDFLVMTTQRVVK